MPGRSFEQQVKEQLADLRMEPDAAVWQGVNAALRQDRKRRWLIWLLALVVCCGSGGVWWFAQQEETGQQRMVQQSKAGDKTIKTENQQIQAESDGTKKAEQSANMKPEITGNNFLSPGMLRNKNQTSRISQELKTGEKKTETKEKAEAKTIVAEAGAVLSVPSTDKNLPVLQNDSAVAKITAVTDTLTPVPAATATALTTPVPKQKMAGNWTWSLYANGGKSGTRNAIFQANVGRLENYYNAPSNGGQIGQPSTSSMPPVLHDAFSLNIGVELTKKIGRSNSIGFALGYGLYQNRIGVGTKKDSTISANSNGRYSNSGEFYYKNAGGGADQLYTNRYHFVEASVDFYTQFRVFKTVSARWQLGTGLAYLLGSNGLHYDKQDNLLFNNNELLRKLHVQLSTGIDFGIGKQPSLYVGPQVRFFVSNLSKQADVNQYLFQPSFKATYILSGKKK